MDTSNELFIWLCCQSSTILLTVFVSSLASNPRCKSCIVQCGKYWRGDCPRNLVICCHLILSSFQDASGRLEWMLHGRNPRFRILELDHLMRQYMWMETSLMESLILRGLLSLVKTGFARILQTTQFIWSAWQLQQWATSVVYGARCVSPWRQNSGVYQCCVSMHGQVSMSTRLWHMDHYICWHK